MIAREDADGVLRIVAAPRQPQRPRRKLARSCFVMKRRQSLASLDRRRRDQLWDGKITDDPRLFGSIDIGKRRIGRAQIDADEEAGGNVRFYDFSHNGSLCAKTARCTMVNSVACVLACARPPLLRTW